MSKFYENEIKKIERILALTDEERVLPNYLLYGVEHEKVHEFGEKYVMELNKSIAKKENCSYRAFLESFLIPRFVDTVVLGEIMDGVTRAALNRFQNVFRGCLIINLSEVIDVINGEEKWLAYFSSLPSCVHFIFYVEKKVEDYKEKTKILRKKLPIIDYIEEFSCERADYIRDAVEKYMRIYDVNLDEQDRLILYNYAQNLDSEKINTMIINILYSVERNEDGVAHITDKQVMELEEYSSSKRRIGFV